MGPQTCPCCQYGAKAEELLPWLRHGSEHPEEWESDLPRSSAGNGNRAEGEIQATGVA